MSTIYNAVTVTTSPTLIIPANSNRRGYGIVNNSSVSLFFGPDTSVSTSNAMVVLSSGNVTDSGNSDVFKGSLYGVVSSGSADIRYWEWTP